VYVTYHDDAAWVSSIAIGIMST